MPVFVDRGVSHSQRGGSPAAIISVEVDGKHNLVALGFSMFFFMYLYANERIKIVFGSCDLDHGIRTHT
jgi:hypothetical protein